MDDKVIISINSGVVTMISKPLGVEVEIQDFDIEDIWDVDDIRCQVDEDGDRFQQMIWKKNVKVG